MLSGDLEAALDHKVHDFGKMLFGRRDVPGVDVGFLEGSKVQLAWGHIIAMRSLHHHWDS